MEQRIPDRQGTTTGPELAALRAVYMDEQRQALYPDLFMTPANEQLFRAERAGSGLMTMAMRHRTLTSRQRAALGVFRLQQFALCGWYDLAVIFERRLLVDPLLAECPDETIHIIVGSQPDCRVLAYFCLQAAAPFASYGHHARSDHARTPRIADHDRPIYPTELDQFGTEVFASLPRLAALPIDRVFELECLLSNRAVTSPLGFAALIEGFYTVSLLVRDRRMGIDALIGNVERRARRVVKSLGVPVLYTPRAPTAAKPHDALWADDMFTPGQFWPFVIATEDLDRHARWFAQLDKALDATTDDMKQSLVELLKQPASTRPYAFVPTENDADSPYFWTDDPFFGDAKDRAHVVSS
ncbi:MAG TPA: hypothetical protein VFN11_12615 [Ktedonobacterales bacterium]|nr:hypothetical protein [Ktedonobacterales bacterium]